MGERPRISIVCECGGEHVFEQTEEKRVEICPDCHAILRVPAIERGQVTVTPVAVPSAKKTPPAGQAPRKAPSAAARPRVAQDGAAKTRKPGVGKTSAPADATEDALVSTAPRPPQSRRRRRRRLQPIGDWLNVPMFRPGHVLGAFAVMYVLVAVFGPGLKLKVNWMSAVVYAIVPFVVVGAFLWGRYLGIAFGAAIGIVVILLLATWVAKISRTGGVTGIYTVLIPALKALAAFAAGFYAAQLAGERHLLNGLAAGTLWAFVVNRVAGAVLRTQRLHGFPLAKLAPVGVEALVYGFLFGAAGALVLSMFSEN